MSIEEAGDGAAAGTENLERLFSSLDVPPLPQAASRLMQMLRDDELAPAELARVITADPGIAARILRVVNSAHVGLPQQVADVRLAVSLLGTSRIQALVVGFSVADALRGRPRHFDHESFWCGGLQRAAFSEVIAAKLCPGKEGEAFTGGLLQDIAQPLLVEQWGDRYAPLVKRAELTKRPLHELELEELGWTHAQAGAAITSAWGLPDVLVAAIAKHHAPAAELRDGGVHRTPVGAVAASSHLPYAAPYCSELELPLPLYATFCKKTDNVCRGLSGLFGVRKPRRLPLPAEQGDVAPDGD